jgi:RNA polymerase sigma factor (sigma-70 family)
MRRSDPLLAQAARSGDPAAWRELVRSHGRLVTSIAASYRLDEADVEDVFQTVFTRLYESLGRLDDATRFSAWLITTTHRECWTLGRRSQKYSDFEQAILNRSVEHPDALLEWEQKYLVHEGLKALGGRCESLLRALFLDPSEPDYEEVGRQLGISTNSIGSMRARCFEKLEPILAQMGFFGPPAK